MTNSLPNVDAFTFEGASVVSCKFWPVRALSLCQVNTLACAARKPGESSVTQATAATLMAVCRANGMPTPAGPELKQAHLQRSPLPIVENSPPAERRRQRLLVCYKRG